MTGDGAAAQRRLLAIMAVDVAGYSRLVEAAEEETLARWRQLRLGVIEPLVRQHRGRVVDTAGDGLLLAFASAVDAMRCAIALQRDPAFCTTTLPQPDFRLRIGVHLADVMVRGSRLSGDGVNVACRLQQACAVGSILASGPVRDEVARVLQLSFVDLGQASFKNIARKIQVYRPAFDNGLLARCPSVGTDHEVQHPRIIVVPFADIGELPRHDGIGEGIATELAAALARIHWLRVYPSVAFWMHWTRGDDLFGLCRELGIRYAVAGRLRCRGSLIRATIELSDCAAGTLLWAQSITSALEDVFRLEDDIVGQVTAAIEWTIRRAEAERARHKPPNELNAHECIARAVPLLHRLSRREFLEAERFLKRATLIRPDESEGYAWHAWWHLLKVGQGWSKMPAADIAAAGKLAAMAVERSEDNPLTLTVCGHIAAFLQHDLEGARDMLQRAIELNPRSAFAWSRYSSTLSYLGEPEAALEKARRSIEVNPICPHPMFLNTAMALANMVGGRYEDAVMWGRRALQVNSNYTAVHRILIASLAHLGRLDEACVVARRMLEIEPAFTLRAFAASYPMRRHDDLARYL